MKLEKQNLDFFINYIKKYPDILSEIFEILESYDLTKLNNFFDPLDLYYPYKKTPLHKGYLTHKDEILKILMSTTIFFPEIPLDPNQEILDKNYIKNTFNNTAPDYDAIMNKFWPGRRQDKIDYLNIKEGEKILEFGIGTGMNFEYYPDNCEIYGIDFAPNMVKYAQKKIDKLNKKNITIQVMDGSNMSFNSNSFDKINCDQAICDVPNPIDVLKEFNRVCKNNGEIFFFEPLKSKNKKVAILQYIFFPIGRVLGHVWITEFPIKKIPYNSFIDLISLLEYVPFKLIECQTFDPFEILHLIKCINK